MAVDDQDDRERYDSSKVRRAVVAIDIAGRNIVSRFASEDSLARKPIVSGDHVYFFGRLPLYAYDSKRRQLAWAAKKSSPTAPGWPMVLGYPIVMSNTVVLAMNELGREGQHTSYVTVLDRLTGRELSTSPDGGVGSFAFATAYVQQGHLLITTAYGLAAYEVVALGAAGPAASDIRNLMLHGFKVGGPLRGEWPVAANVYVVSSRFEETKRVAQEIKDIVGRRLAGLRKEDIESPERRRPIEVDILRAIDAEFKGEAVRDVHLQLDIK